MASMNPPTSVDDWAHQAKSLHGEETLSYSTLAQALASNPAVKFSSASKVPYAAWLLLKVVWQKHTGPITHTTIFGENEEVWKDPARKRLQKQPWYSAFKERDPNPMKWLHMANWKQSADEIVSRPADLMNVSSGGVSFDADNPFNFSKATSHAHHRPEGKRLADSSRLSPRPTPSSSSSPPAMRAFSPGVSPSRSNEMGLSGGPGTSRSGSFTNADSSPDSGREEENRLVNKFRPDEALINASIISLLQGIWMPTQQRRDGLYKGYVWSVVHRQLTIPEPVSHGSSASNSKRKNILTAKTDGCFRAPHRRHPDDGDVLAIIEVKPYRRDATAHNLRSVRVQEGAEMAAWIALESNKGLLPASLGTYRRVLISQDFDHIYVTIANFDDKYIQYIRGNTQPTSIPQMPEASPSQRGRPRERDSKIPAARPETPVPGSNQLPYRPVATTDPTSRSRSPQPPQYALPQFYTPQRPTKSLSPPDAPRGGQQYMAPNTTAVPISNQLPSRHLATAERTSRSRSPHPTQPSTPQRPTKSLSPPDAPKGGQQDLALAPQTATNPGYLTMHEYAPFKLDDPVQMEELFLLLENIMYYIAREDQRARFDPMRAGSYK